MLGFSSSSCFEQCMKVQKANTCPAFQLTQPYIRTGKSKSTATAQNVRLALLRNVRMIQNFHLVWLDRSIGDINDNGCRISITKLREAVNKVNSFINPDECIDFIESVNEEEVLFTSFDGFGQTTVSLVHEKPQVNTMYIFCGNKTYPER